MHTTTPAGFQQAEPVPKLPGAGALATQADTHFRALLESFKPAALLAAPATYTLVLISVLTTIALQRPNTIPKTALKLVALANEVSACSSCVSECHSHVSCLQLSASTSACCLHPLFLSSCHWDRSLWSHLYSASKPDACKQAMRKPVPSSHRSVSFGSESTARRPLSLRKLGEENGLHQRPFGLHLLCGITI